MIGSVCMVTSGTPDWAVEVQFGRHLRESGLVETSVVQVPISAQLRNGCVTERWRENGRGRGLVRGALS